MYKVTVQPAFEPVTLLEAKEWLKVHPDVVEDDDLIRALISAARVWAEGCTGQALIEQTVEQVWDCYHTCFELSLYPLISVTKLEYRDADGNYTTWSSSNYTVDDISYPPRIVAKLNTTIPATGQNVYPNQWKATYKAGNTTALRVDANIKTAMLLQIGMMYENREDIPIARGGSSHLARSAYNLLAISRMNMI